MFRSVTRTDLPDTPLLERQTELAAIDEVLDQAAAGRGGTLLIEGPAGIGKTRLLDRAAAEAGGRGFRVLAARASPLEREFAFGVVRGLLEPVAQAAGTEWSGAAGLAAPVLDPGGAGATPTFAVLHGVHWMVVGLADTGPLLLVVDDGHWADGASLRAVHHLARRVDELPVLIVLATRPTEPGADVELLDAIRAEPATTVLRPAPLSGAATAAVLRRTLGDEVDPRFDAACHEAAGGNPLLLGALVGSLRQAGVAPGADGVAAVRERAPGIVSAFVLPRLRHLPRPAVAVARALAVLGPGAALRSLASVAGLAATDAASALDQLADAELITGDPVDFAHPLLGQAVLDRMPTAERLAGHQRAARELAADGAPVESVAAHLLQLEPLRDPWVVARLREAAADGLAAGAPQAAARYLDRALAEPPDADERIDVLTELGEALCQAGSTAGFDRLQQALDLADDPRRRDRIALSLARHLQVAWELPRALAVLDRAAGEIDARGAGDSAVALIVEAELIGLARAVPELRPKARERLDRLRPEARPDSVPGRTLLANLAVDLMQEPGTAADAVDHARAALDGLDGGLSAVGVLYLAGPVLIAAGELTAATAAADRIAVRARARGAPLEMGAALGVRGDAAARRGALLDAEADLRMAQDVLDADQMPYPARLLAGYLLPVLVAMGRPAEAEHEVTLQVDHRQVAVLAALGRLRIAQGRPDEALEALLACGARLAKRDWRHPGLLPWRTDAALACHRLGRARQAGELVDRALAEAQRFAAAIPLGRALLVTGLLRADIDVLREAVDVLRGTPARLEQAGAYVELGAALRRANRRAEAREPLRTGLELAHRCAAAPLVDRATEELAAAGARPRTPLRTGVESLSPSERRVARLAADGMTNREIAQALFVTAKTVEVHLSACYRKLGIGTRRELDGVFD
jgi:DNA-binding CsgD family transcriptional regulator